jgi:hypothetical protein
MCVLSCGLGSRSQGVADAIPPGRIAARSVAVTILVESGISAAGREVVVEDEDSPNRQPLLHRKIERHPTVSILMDLPVVEGMLGIGFGGGLVTFA